MEKVIEKISNYHIFNYIIPGSIFLIICSEYLHLLTINRVLSFIVISYFVGIIISRISSLITEKIIIKVFKVKKEPYCDFIKAAKKDEKIDIILQDRNMYRNIVTTIIIVLLLKVMVVFKFIKYLKNQYVQLIIIFFLIILFILSYIKQNNYLILRINNRKK